MQMLWYSLLILRTECPATLIQACPSICRGSVLVSAELQITETKDTESMDTRIHLYLGLNLFFINDPTQKKRYDHSRRKQDEWGIDLPNLRSNMGMNRNIPAQWSLLDKQCLGGC